MFETETDFPMGLAKRFVGREVKAFDGVHRIFAADDVGDMMIVALGETTILLDPSDTVEIWDKRTKKEAALNRTINSASRYPKRQVKACDLKDFLGHYAFVETSSRTTPHRIFGFTSWGGKVRLNVSVTELIGRLEQRLEFA